MRHPKRQCSECWTLTTARCVVCGEPICSACAMPSETSFGPAMLRYNGRRGWLCAVSSPEHYDAAMANARGRQ